MTKCYITHLRKMRKFRNTMRGRSEARGAIELEWTRLWLLSFSLDACSSGYAWLKKRLRSLSSRTNREIDLYIRANAYMTGVACEGARVARKHVRLVRAVETNWNYRRAQSEVYSRDGNCLRIYACYVQGVQKEFKLAFKIRNRDWNRNEYR